MQKILNPGFRIVFFILVTGQSVPFSSTAQITSAGYSYVAQTGYAVEYPDTSITDNIYIFCNATGNLTAAFAEAPGDKTYEWSMYDSLLTGFDEPFLTDFGVTSNIADVESGGYQVRITNGTGIDTLFRAWVFVNRPLAFIDRDQINHTCNDLTLSGMVDIDTFFYFHPVDGERYYLPVDYEFFWTADPFVPISRQLTPGIWPIPSVVTDYTLTVSYYQCESDYSITEDPVTTNAEFQIEPLEGEAPLEVRFDASASQNALDYEWFFYYHPDTTNIFSPDDYSFDPVHTFYVPRDYNVMLRTVSQFFCESFYIYPEPIRVLPSELEIPNVFSPDGDGFNDIFIVRSLSLRKFNGVIFNRNGRKVFEWSDPSEGWDGKIEGNNPASPGVYFYIITGVGWDDEIYEFTGPLYLYRGR